MPNLSQDISNTLKRFLNFSMVFREARIDFGCTSFMELVKISPIIVLIFQYVLMLG